MQREFKLKIGNKVNVEYSVTRNTPDEIMGDILNNPDSQLSDKSLAAKTTASTIRSRNIIREKRNKGINFTIGTLLVFESIDQTFYDGKATEAVVVFVKKSIHYISKNTIKLLN